MNRQQTLAEREAALTASQAHAVRELELAFACYRINDGATTTELFEYLETIAQPGESVDDLRRDVMRRYLADVAA